MDDQNQDFKDQLDQEHEWPDLFMFKFIVPRDRQSQIEALFKPEQITSKASKRGNYVSITAKVTMQSSDEVIAIYEAAYRIEGVIAL
jgi:putative lipoic acid-binding regulatory protein